MANYPSNARLLVVAEEPNLASDIRKRITNQSYDITGPVSSMSSTIQYLEENRSVDCLIIDIALNGKFDGIELAALVKSKFRLPVILLTSSTDKEIVERAKVIQPSAYILKPFDYRQLNVAIEMALPTSRPSFDPRKQRLSISNLDDPWLHDDIRRIEDSLFLKHEHYFQRVLFKDIKYIQADNNYCSVFTKSSRFIYSIVLKKFEVHLPPSLFLRVHRSFVINIQAIEGFEGNMLLIGGSKIPVSKSYREQVFKLLHIV